MIMHPHRIQPSPTIPGSEVHGFRCYENTTSRHAFWCCWYETSGKYTYFCWKYGAIGTVGRTGSKRFNGMASAGAYGDNKRYEKENRDYVMVESAGPPKSIFGKALDKIAARYAASSAKAPPAPKVKDVEADLTHESALDLLLEL